MFVANPRFIPVGRQLLALCGLLTSAAAQQVAEDPPPAQEDRLATMARALPDYLLVSPYYNEFSVSMRFVGRANVTFSNLGTITTPFDEDDPSEFANRVYADGYVSLDQRGAGNSEQLGDGMTNTWSYEKADQITDDGSGIMFHAYASTPNDATVHAESTAGVMPDMEYSRLLWQFGRWRTPRRRELQMGWLGGWGLSRVNAKHRGSTTADLIITTDTYSLNGAPAPVDYDEDGVDDDGNPIEGYTGPSTTTVTIVGEDGITYTYEVDNTTLLGARPIDRTVQTIADGAEIQGFWQVDGAYFTLRSGPWVRWEPIKNISLKLSGGGTFTLLGLSMRYNEKLVIDSETSTDEVSEQSDVQVESYAGLFGSVDAEWLLNERTSFFASAYYEDFDEELSLEVGGRQSNAEVGSGLGMRFGISTRF